jgi:hypothetical protein
MHTRNIALTTLAWAILLSLLLTLFPDLTHFDALGIFYFPAILLSVIFSSGEHLPSVMAGWSAFLIYTLFYWAVLLIGYAFYLEFRILHNAWHLLENTAQQLASDNPDHKLALEKFGQALREIERNRRTHIVLKNMDGLDLNAQPQRLAAHAGSKFLHLRPVKGLFKHLETQLIQEVGAEQAGKIIAELKQFAADLHEEKVA